MTRTLGPIYLLALVTFLAPPATRPAQGQNAAALEYELKAAFLVSFANFVEWPAEAFRDEEEAVTIGVLGTDPFGPALDQIASQQSIRGRACLVRRCRDVADAAACHVLFISAGENDRLREILEPLVASPTLTVGESEDFIARGGIINFILEKDTVRFEINQTAAERAGLRIQSKLLRLAKPGSP